MGVDTKNEIERERDEKKSGTTTSCSPFVLVYFNEIKMS